MVASDRHWMSSGWSLVSSDRDGMAPDGMRCNPSPSSHNRTPSDWRTTSAASYVCCSPGAAISPRGVVVAMVAAVKRGHGGS